MDYSFAYAKRRGLVGGNPTVRYKPSDMGKYVPAKGLHVGCRVKVIGLDDYMIGPPKGLGQTGTIVGEEFWRLGYIFTEYEERKTWKVKLDKPIQRGREYDWVYWEHDLEII